MAGQIQELLSRVEKQLSGVVALLEELQERDREHGRELGNVRERLAALERDGKWSGEERRKVDGRLETGDNTFKAIREEIAQVDRTAKWCRDQLQKKETTRRQSFLWRLAEAGAPMFVGLAWWLMYHFFLIGPKLAELMKHAGGHP